jgi:hypothetical protein
MRLWQALTAGGVGGAVNDSDIVMHATSVNNATTLQHGFAPQLSGVATTFYSGTGLWLVPGGSSDVALLFDAMAVDSGDSYLYMDFGA